MPQLPPKQPDDQSFVYDFRVTLNGEQYRYRLIYHYRADEWFFDFGTLDTWWLTGERLVIDTPLLGWLRDADGLTGPGERILILGDLDNEGVECDLAALGDRCVLLLVELDPSVSTAEVVTISRVV
jgi:hypothetical protein